MNENSRRSKFFSKRTVTVLCIFFALFLVAALFFVSSSNEQTKYDKAIKCLEKREYEEAFELFKELGNYKDSYEYLGRFLICYDQEEIWVHDGGNRITEYNFDKKGQWISKIEKDAKSGKVRSSFEYTYDSDGNLVAEQWNHIGGEVSRREYEYDLKGNQILSRSIKDGIVSYVYRFEYDEEGNRIKTIKDNVVTSEYEYDTKNQLVKEVTFDEGVAKVIRKYVYDSNGNKVSCEILAADGQRRLLTEYKYNGAGKEVWSKETYRTGEISKLTECTYDENNNLLTKRTETSDRITVEEYQYDNNNMVLKRVSALDTSVFADEDEEYVLYNEIKNTYDENGNRLSEYRMNYNENYGKDESTTSYTYDEEGNKIRADYSSGWNRYAYYGKKHITYKEDFSWYKSY